MKQIKGYDLLADDYVTKPFSMPLLLHKINALLRRSEPSGVQKNTVICYSGIVMNSSYFYYKDKENLVPRALANSYPLMILVVVTVSLISSMIYTVLFALPVKKLSRASHAMAGMDFTVRCDERRKDEIGDLARDLNRMSSALNMQLRLHIPPLCLRMRYGALRMAPPCSSFIHTLFIPS